MELIFCAASGRYQKPIAILADLPGPKIRTGSLEGGQPVLLRNGQRFAISTERLVGNAQGVSVNYPRLHAEVRRGDRILLSDGLIELRVESYSGKRILCRVINGGQTRRTERRQSAGRSSDCSCGHAAGPASPGVRAGAAA